MQLIIIMIITGRKFGNLIVVVKKISARFQLENLSAPAWLGLARILHSSGSLEPEKFQLKLISSTYLLYYVANRVSYFLNSNNTGIMTSLQGFPCMPLVHFCRCSLNHFDPVLRPLLYSQFLTVRCEHYQICAKKS